MRNVEPGTGNRNAEPRMLNQELGNGSNDATTCPRCGESHDLAKVKGCIKCLKCGFKFDCNGW